MKELVASIVEDGVVDAAEVVEIRNVFYADGIIDREEADAMFAINDAVTGNDNAEEYALLFVKVLSDYVLEDEVSPGIVDVEEGDYLVDKIGADGQVDDAEKALLLNLAANATSIESDALKILIEKVSN
jgi:uncharacterized tellurite resistance protein B-like protein